jgi:hypothetical protein
MIAGILDLRVNVDNIRFLSLRLTYTSLRELRACISHSAGGCRLFGMPCCKQSGSRPFNAMVALPFE